MLVVGAAGPPGFFFFWRVSAANVADTRQERVSGAAEPPRSPTANAVLLSGYFSIDTPNMLVIWPDQSESCGVKSRPLTYGLIR